MLARILNAIFSIVIYAACANITTPNGGPKDVTPPRLISSTPSNKQKNFNEKTIQLEFNEFVKLNNPKEEIIISPSAGDEVDVKVKQNKVLITPKNGWAPETTYTIQFRESIKDITEGNAPSNMKLAFSTGATIDSLRISGTVTELLKGSAAEKMTVAIYQQDTFDIFTDKPSYFTKTDKLGRFTLDNLKNGQYRIYAWDDRNKNLKVESKTEQYAFLSKNVILNTNVDTIALNSVMMDSRPLKISSIRNIGNITRVRFSKYLTEYSLDSDSTLINNFGDNSTEVTIWNPQEVGDSVTVKLQGTDSLLQKIDSTFFVKKTDIKPITEDFRWSILSPTVEAETGNFKATIKFNKPINYVNFDSLFILRDTVEIIPITMKDLQINTKTKEIAVQKTLSKALFQAEIDPVFTLIAGKGFLYTIDKDSSKAAKEPIPTLWPEDTGILVVEIKTKKPHFIIQVISPDFRVITSARDVNKFTFKNLPASQYQLRAVIDENNNGKWDPGNVMKNIEPEKIIYYKNSEKKQIFPLRANWEYGPATIKF